MTGSGSKAPAAGLRPVVTPLSSSRLHAWWWLHEGGRLSRVVMVAASGFAEECG